MSTITLEVKGLKQLVTAMQNYPKLAEPVLQRAMAAAQAVLAKYTTRTTVPFRTGNLVQTFRYEIGRLQVRWFPTARYALFVHEGTGIYGKYGQRIVPKNKLALFWKSALHPVKSVRGSRANPYMPRVARAAQVDVNKVMEAAGKRITDEIARSTRM